MLIFHIYGEIIFTLDLSIEYYLDSCCEKKNTVEMDIYFSPCRVICLKNHNFKALSHLYHRDLNALSWKGLIILCLVYVPYS